MTKAQRASRPTNAIRRANAAQQPNEHREKLLAVGVRLFVERGIGRVSVEQPIEEAAGSRATLYGCFANKNELAAAILFPIFDSGIAALGALHDLSPARTAEALINIYLDLWQNHRIAPLLTGSFDGMAFLYIQRQHDLSNMELAKALKIVESGGLLRTESAELTLEVLAKTAAILLCLISKSIGRITASLLYYTLLCAGAAMTAVRCQHLQSV